MYVKDVLVRYNLGESIPAGFLCTVVTVSVSVSLLFDRGVCPSRPECLSVTRLRFVAPQ